MEPPTDKQMRCRYVFAVTGVLVGLSVAIVFAIVFYNPDTAAWALLSGVFASVTFAVHVKYTRDQWSTWSNHLRALMLVGCLGQLAGVCGFAVYLALAVSEHQALTGYGRAFYVSSVWSAMTWKWSFLLFVYTRNYRRLYEQRTGMCADVGYQKV